MFGGLAFMVNGNMACGIVRDELMLRLGAEGARRPSGTPASGRWTSRAGP